MGYTSVFKYGGFCICNVSCVRFKCKETNGAGDHLVLSLAVAYITALHMRSCALIILQSLLLRLCKMPWDENQMTNVFICSCQTKNLLNKSHVGC